jgi:hypothetical protein
MRPLLQAKSVQKIIIHIYCYCLHQKNVKLIAVIILKKMRKYIYSI